MWDEKDYSFYDKLGVDRPSHDKHGEDSWEHPISEKLAKAQCRNWRQQGNMLVCDTNWGKLTQFIPTDVFLVGTDKNGNPKLEKK